MLVGLPGATAFWGPLFSTRVVRRKDSSAVFLCWCFRLPNPAGALEKKTLQKHDLRGKTVTEQFALAVELVEIEELEDKIAPSGSWDTDGGLD